MSREGAEQSLGEQRRSRAEKEQRKEGPDQTSEGAEHHTLVQAMVSMWSVKTVPNPRDSPEGGFGFLLSTSW